MKKISYALLVLFFALLGTEVYAQIGKRASREFQRAQSRRISRYSGAKGFAKSNQFWTIGGAVGYANYFGDLAPDVSPVSTVYDQATPYFNFFIGKRLSPYLTLKANLGYMRIAADDANVDPTKSESNKGRYIRNLSFANNIFEGGFTLQADLFPTAAGAMRRNFLNPYGFIGINAFTNNPQALGPKGSEFADTWVDLRPLKTEGQGTPYGLVNVSLPFGIGVRYRVSNNIDVGLELGYRITFTNYLDDVGTTYPGFNALSNMTPLARTMSMRSGERYTAASGADRFTNISQSEVRPLQLMNNDGVPTTFEAVPGVYNGNVVNVYTGNNNGGAPRGGAGRDYIFVTGVHLTYIIPDNSRGPRGRF